MLQFNSNTAREAVSSYADMLYSTNTAFAFPRKINREQNIKPLFEGYISFEPVRNTSLWFLGENEPLKRKKTYSIKFFGTSGVKVKLQELWDSKLNRKFKLCFNSWAGNWRWTLEKMKINEEKTKYVVYIWLEYLDINRLLITFCSIFIVACTKKYDTKKIETQIEKTKTDQLR